MDILLNLLIDQKVTHIYALQSFFMYSFYRLQYFAREVQIYIKQLRQTLQGKTGEALKTDEVHFNYLQENLSKDGAC